MLSEGIAICIMPIYVFSLAFDRALAASIAEKNGKALAVAMLVSFATLLAHVVNGWLSDDAAYANYAETKNASPQYSE